MFPPSRPRATFVVVLNFATWLTHQQAAEYDLSAAQATATFGRIFLDVLSRTRPFCRYLGSPEAIAQARLNFPYQANRPRPRPVTTTTVPAPLDDPDLADGPFWETSSTTPFRPPWWRRTPGAKLSTEDHLLIAADDGELWVGRTHLAD